MIPVAQSANMTVKTMTAVLFLCLFGCTFAQESITNDCNSRAYVKVELQEYLTTRFHENSPIRVAIMPFSVPANIALGNDHTPGVGRQMAHVIHSELLAAQMFPIVEVFYRFDWPGKRQEFFKGNHGAIDFARQAGYDLALVGHLENFRAIDAASALYKLIEVESGITIWHGKTNVRANIKSVERSTRWLAEVPRDLQLRHLSPMIDHLSACIVQSIAEEQNYYKIPDDAPADVDNHFDRRT